jgi:2-polyprenyl-3-methyl-5-hydroxy-6-metoxy-1,4-benzoquinol methylase
VDKDCSRFYDSLAEDYHLIFDDWNRAMERQSNVLGPLLERDERPLRILDCACGIGTQAIELAMRGHAVVASDLSPAEVARARREAEQRNLALIFHVADMRDLSAVSESEFDAVIAMDNALPHLDEEALRQAARAIHAKLKSRGQVVVSIRDYDALLTTKPRMQEPAMYGADGKRRIVHQVWDWVDERSYILHLYITQELDGAWKVDHFVSEYHAITREEMTRIFVDAGFIEIRWLFPEESGFYQPIMLANKT